MIKIMFSPTGGTRKVVSALAGRRNCEVIDLTDWETDFDQVEIRPDELMLFAVPSYAGRVPAPASERFSKIRGNGAKAALVCVYGNRAYEDTLAEMVDLAEEAGFQVIAAVAALAEHVYFPEYARKRPDKKDRKRLAEIMDLIEEKVARDNWEKPFIPGNRPYKERKDPSFYPVFHMQDCVSCAMCLASCPAGAVWEDYTPDPALCISCTRCIKICPAGARSLPKDQVLALQEKIAPQCEGRKKIELFL